MTTVFKILPFFLILTCCNNADSSSNSSPVKTVLVKNNVFASCFSGADTSKTDLTICCGQYIYKVIGDKYVIQITLDLPKRLDTCYTISADSLNVKLIVFDNKGATLSNLCSDIIITSPDTPKTRELSAKEGQLIIAFSNPTKLYGNTVFHRTILIKNILFLDKSGERIEFKNETLWKVLDIGTPG